MTSERQPLAGRYVLERPLASAKDSDRFFAVEVATGKRVVVAIVDAGRLSTLEPARGVKHRHLAGVIDILRDFDRSALPPETPLPAGAGVVVAEHIPGKTLRAQLEGGKLDPNKA